MLSIGIYIGAALAEIAGCFTMWVYLRQGRSIFWLFPGVLSLGLFAFLLTRIESDFAGRAYAAYGGVYIATSIGWLSFVEGKRPDQWDLTGAIISIIGAGIILWGPRSG